MSARTYAPSVGPPCQGRITHVARGVVFSGSQNERIGMLRMVLSEKGIVAGAHYDVVATPAPDTSRRMQNRQNGLEDDIEEHPREEADAIRAEEEAEGGVYL